MSISNTDYTSALEKTKNIFGNTSVGFVGENPSQTSTAKQLNTLIQLVIQVHTKLGVIEDEVKRLKERLPTTGTSTGGKDYLADLDDITKRLSNLKVTKEPVVQGTLKVLKKF
ncbi:virion associated protein [Banana streak UL virus]|uniref:Virion associated protein n=1 Tax=Banana streak UL virus TaxID=1016856 RepID=F5AY23_9VIRU|nr:virion associated protein [Banana streak UL virus]AEC49880.1 virion associated protein [Banana streak UL virus]